MVDARYVEEVVSFPAYAGGLKRFGAAAAATLAAAAIAALAAAAGAALAAAAAAAQLAARVRSIKLHEVY